MISNLGRWIGKDREEAIFLPILVFGYIYVEFDDLYSCFDLFSLELSEQVFLVLTIVCAIVAAILYAVLTGLDSNLSRVEARNRLKSYSFGSQIVLTGLVLIYISLLITSIGELVLRLCNQDIVIIGLAIFSLVLITVSTTEMILE